MVVNINGFSQFQEPFVMVIVTIEARYLSLLLITTVRKAYLRDLNQIVMWEI